MRTVIIDGVAYVPETINCESNIGLQGILRFRREELGWTLDRAADATGLSRTYLHELETGKRNSPSLLVAARLSAAYRIDIQALANAVMQAENEDSTP